MLSTMLARRSVSPKRLRTPGPTSEELALIVEVALRAPDHGRLVPWRLVEFPASSRKALAGAFEQEKLRRYPVASPEDLERAREHALRSPVVLAFVVRPRPSVAVPVHEQWLSAGAAMGNLLMACHALGYGAIMLSGERCHDRTLQEKLSVHGDEVLAGFISIGTIARAPPSAPPVDRPGVWTQWRARESVAHRTG